LFLQYFIFAGGIRKSGRMLQSNDHFCLRKSMYVNAEVYSQGTSASARYQMKVLSHVKYDCKRGEPC